ncbi:hypothetical protein COOONC_00758 [Cooperia oncophora]
MSEADKDLDEQQVAQGRESESEERVVRSDNEPLLLTNKLTNTPESSPFAPPEPLGSWAEQMSSPSDSIKETVILLTDITDTTTSSHRNNILMKKITHRQTRPLPNAAEESQQSVEPMDTSEIVHSDNPLELSDEPDSWLPVGTNSPQQERAIKTTAKSRNDCSVTKKRKESRPKKDIAKKRNIRMNAVLTFLQELHSETTSSDTGGPLKPNTSATSLIQCPQVTNYSTTEVPYTVEELTAHPLRKVFDYITTNNTLRDQIHYQTAAKVVHLLQTLLEVIENSTRSFHSLSVFLSNRHPLDCQYTHLMSWIQELTHCITAVTVNKDQLQENHAKIVQCYAANGGRNTTTCISYYSACDSHDTHSGNYQVIHIVSPKRISTNAMNKQYGLNMATGTSQTWSEYPSSYMSTLSWWRDHYSEALMGGITENCPLTIPQLSRDNHPAREKENIAIILQLRYVCSIKRHYGTCIRKDPCSQCREEGYHRVFCVKNPRVEPDICMKASEFYPILQVQTYRPPPPGARIRPKHIQSLRKRAKGAKKSQKAQLNSTSLCEPIQFVDGPLWPIVDSTTKQFTSFIPN